MIGKATTGGGARGVLEYLLEDGKGYILGSNMAAALSPSPTPRAIAREFGEIRKLRPSLGKAVFHTSLALPPGEHLTDEQWGDVVQRYLEAMGFSDNQYIAVRHTDTKHEHVHILVNRITFSGDVVSDSHNWRRQEHALREIERQFGLRQVAPSSEALRKAPTKGEIEMALRTGQPSVKAQLQDLCDAAALGCESFTEYVERLEAVGVDVIPTVQLDGAKLSGIQYRLDGVVMKGSDLGKAYAAAGIQKKGVTYDKERDFAAVERCRQREADRILGYADRALEASQTRECGELGCDAGAVSSVHGSTGGRDAADARASAAAQQSRGAEPFATGCADRNAGAEPSADKSHTESESAAVHAGDSQRSDSSGAYQRIVDLACTQASCNTESARSGRAHGASRDRTLEAVQRQIAAMGVARFEVGVRESATGKMLNKNWSASELVNALPWLKRMNAKGNDVYIRPAGGHGLVLVDDLKPQALERMKAEGFAPAAIIETSPGNYQAWVKLSDKPLSADVRRIAARELTKRYGGDMNSADSRHYGRLAGFTNRKPKYERDGRQPYVLAHQCTGHVAPKACELLTNITESLDKADVARERERRRIQIDADTPHALHAVREYRRQARALLARYGSDADMSRVDWMVAKDMAAHGWAAEDIAKAIMEASPAIETRKVGHMEDYALRTAQKAYTEVWGASNEREQDHHKETKTSGPKM